MFSIYKYKLPFMRNKATLIQIVTKKIENIFFFKILKNF